MFWLAPLAGILHFVSALALLLGIVFLVVWALKTLAHHQWKTVGIWLVVLGLLGCLLSVGMGFTMARHGGFWMDGKGGFEKRMMRWDGAKMMDTGGAVDGGTMMDGYNK